LWLRGDIEAARQQYQALLELGCEPEVVRRNLAGLAWQQGNPAGAEELFVQAEKTAAADKELRLERCLLKLRNGEPDKAREVLEAFEQETGSAIQAAHGYLAAAEGQWSAAERLLKSAATERPDDAWVRINRGIALVHLQRYAEAEEAFREAVRIAPGLPQAHRLLGQLYASQGLYREAHLSLSTSLRLDPNQPQVKQLVDRISGWIGGSGV
jgi:Flp pilus assembly protein TadD